MISNDAEEIKLKARNIWENSFQDSEDFTNFYFNNIYDEKNFLRLEKNGEILSSLYINPYSIVLNSHIIESKYIVGVATLPKHSGKGYMKSLITKTLQDLKNDNIDFVFLLPINPDLYRKYGFEYFSYLDKLYFNMESFNAFHSIKNYTTVELNEHNLEFYLEDIKQIYIKNMDKKSMYLDVNLDFFKSILKENKTEDGSIYLFFEDNKASAYLIINFSEDTIEVREFFANNYISHLKLFSFMNEFKKHYNKVEIISKRNSKIDFFFSNQLEIKKEALPFTMGRILNPKNMLSKLNIINEDISIYIVDDLIPENTGVYTLSEDISFSKFNKDYDFKISIADLTMLISSFFSFKDLLELGKIELNRTENLDYLNKTFLKVDSYIQVYI